MVKQKNMPSIETQKKMHAFFMKTSAPRIWQKEKEAAEKEGQSLKNNDLLEIEQNEE